MEHRPTFWQQFRDDPIVVLGPPLAMVPVGLLVFIVQRLGG